MKRIRESRFHEFRGGRLCRRAAPPVATARDPFGAKTRYAGRGNIWPAESYIDEVGGRDRLVQQVIIEIMSRQQRKRPFRLSRWLPGSRTGLACLAVFVLGLSVIGADALHTARVPQGLDTTYKLLALITVIVGVILVLIIIRFGRLSHRLQLRSSENQCLNCGYNLTGNVSGICPECGTRYSRKHLVGKTGRAVSSVSEHEGKV